jgi:UDP-N-acetylglucosamine 2-epimerase (non-hydrolysing)
MSHIFIVGTRAQLIKVAPVIKEFEQNNMPVIFILTGQHNDTMDDLINEFGITSVPISLIKNKEHSSIFALLLWIPIVFTLLFKTLKKYNKSYVFVHGDTLTTLLSTLSARVCRHQVVHLESGLTSKNIFSPFPEELIRRVVFRFTNIACCPQKNDILNMEKYSHIKIINTKGNTILDSIQHLNIGKNIINNEKSILVSLHRFQNIYNRERLNNIKNMLINLSTEYTIYFVLHPATFKKLKSYDYLKELEKADNIELLPRMTYKNFLNLALSTNCVITDGGSNQEELAFFGHPTIILRDTTERADGIGKNAIIIESPEDVCEFIDQNRYLALQYSSSELYESPSSIIKNYFQNQEVNL